MKHTIFASLMIATVAFTVNFATMTTTSDEMRGDIPALVITAERETPISLDAEYVFWGNLPEIIVTANRGTPNSSSAIVMSRANRGGDIEDLVVTPDLSTRSITGMGDRNTRSAI
jgi:hypothetical protein